MQINNMLPVLLGMLTGQAGKGKVNKAPPRQGTDEAVRQGADRSQSVSSLAKAGGTGERDIQSPGRQPAAPAQALPDFLPLPLKSPLFRESAFYVKNNREESRESPERERTAVFIRLRTSSLGVVWVSMASGRESLAISFFTEKEGYTASLRESFPELEKGLQDLGYASVNMAGITRPGIRDCSDIAPGVKASGIYLLDLEV